MVLKINKINILIIILLGIIVAFFLSYSSGNTTIPLKIINKYGTLSQEQYDFYYSDYNNVLKCKKNEKDDIIVYDDKYSLYGGIIINDKIPINTKNKVTKKI